MIAPARLAAELSSDPRLRALSFESTSSGSDYRAALAALDAAVGSLAYDRWNLTEGAPMKVRDYADAGIPTILPYRDTNLGSVEDPALLHLSDWRETSALVSWLPSISGLRVAALTRRAVAINSIEERRLDLLNAA